MRKLITGSLMLCSILSLRAQTFVKPAVKVKDTSFAVITDKGTFQACEAELKAYQEILGMEGLPTFIVYNEWNKPEVEYDWEMNKLTIDKENWENYLQN